MMPRMKRGTAAEIAASQAAAKAFREQFERLPPEPVTAPASRTASPPPFPPLLLYKELRRMYLENLRPTIEASLIPLPVDDDDEFVVPSQEDEYQGMMNKLRLQWEHMGFYSHHPNHNPANASEDEVEAILRGHPKLGRVLKEYKILLNPPKMHSLLLQFPTRNRHEEYRTLNNSKPLELRIKPKCGIVELDVPVDLHNHYDIEKGVMYGRALRTSHTLQHGGSFGLAGGHGVDNEPITDYRAPNMLQGPSTERLLENFDDANNKGYVMNKITLGGMIIPFKEGDPIYMSAAFSGDECTWTRIDAIVDLRPQMTHIDALQEPERAVKKAEMAREAAAAKAAEEREKAELEAEARAEARAAGRSEAKAVNLTVKSAEDNDDDDDEDFYGGMRETAKLLTAMRDEPWQRLEWIDQDDDESFQVYDENLVYQDSENAPRLVSNLTEEQYLDAISAPRIDPAKQAKKALKLMASSGASTVSSTEDEDDEKEELDLDDTDSDEDAGKETESLPAGVVRPTERSLQVRIEIVCRAICSKPVKQHRAVEAHLKKKVQGKPNYRFIDPHNTYHRYYEWRLAENRAGRGYAPEDDLPKLAR